ncbi:DUF4352 domain-containing protein [Nocardia sp. CC227C]|nr:DUF4352 domain-containing protein [Nocardia sp. CC227C]
MFAAATILGASACGTDDLAVTKAAAQERDDVQMTAHPAPFVPSVLHDGSPATAVTVMVTNTSPDKALDVNPLNFSITDAEGMKHTVDLGSAADQLAVTELQPGESVQGVIAAEGEFVPAKVTFSKMLGGSLIVDVTPA